MRKEPIEIALNAFDAEFNKGLGRKLSTGAYARGRRRAALHAAIAAYAAAGKTVEHA